MKSKVAIGKGSSAYDQLPIGNTAADSTNIETESSLLSSMHVRPSAHTRTSTLAQSTKHVPDGIVDTTDPEPEA